LYEVVELNVKRGVVAINRLYGKREIQVSADLGRADVSATDANNDIRENVVPQILASYPSVTASYEGQKQRGREITKLNGESDAHHLLAHALRDHLDV